MRAGVGRGEPAADEVGEKIVHHLAPTNPGERTVLAADADARMQQHGHEEPRVAVEKAQRRDLVDPLGERHSNTSSATRGSKPRPPLRLEPLPPPSRAPVAR